MKNRFSIILVLTLGLFVVLGCGLGNFGGSSSGGDKSGSSGSGGNSGKDKSLTDKAIEQVADGETTGVPECDELFELFREQSKSQDDNWFTKGTKDYIIGIIKKQIKEDLEKNKNDKAKMAENCTDARLKYEKAIKEEPNSNK